MLIASVALLVLVIAALLGVGVRSGILSPLSLLGGFLLVGLGLRAVQLAPWVLAIDLEGRLISAIIELTIALIFLLLGYWMGVTAFSVRQVRCMAMQLITPVQSRSRSLIVLIIGVGAFALFFLFMTISYGSLENMWLNLRARDIGGAAGTGYIALLSDITIVTSAIAAQCRFGRSGEDRCTRSNFLFPVLALASLVLLIVLGGRGAILQFVLVIAIIVSLCRPRQATSRWPLLGIVLLSVSVVVLGYASRYSAQRNIAFGDSLTVTMGNLGNTLSAPFALLDHYMLAKEFVARRGLDLGAELPIFLSQPIPRAFWPEKPRVLPLRIREEFWRDMSGGIPATIFGEFYIAFGLAGVFSGAILLGVGVGVLRRLYGASMLNPELSVLYALLTVIAVFTAVRSGLEIGVTRVVVIVVILGAMSVALRSRVKWQSEKYKGRS